MTEPATLDLSIIITAWNARDLVLDCLASLEAAQPEITCEVIVVDNGSVDGTAAAVKERFAGTVLVELPTNAGFSAGNNQGLRVMRGRYAMLLNSDTLVGPGSLEACVSYLDGHPEVGIVGPRLLNPDGSNQASVHRAPTILSAIVPADVLQRVLPNRYPGARTEYSGPSDVESILGAALVIRRETVDEIGEMDAGYQFFFEDTDWCYRARQAGWRVVYLPDPTIVHLYGASTAKKMPVRTLIEYFRSHYRFIDKHYPAPKRLLMRLLMRARVLLGTVMGGRADDYRQIRRWHRDGQPVEAGLKGAG